jgi:dolichol-phosphate mannosyltransferase
MPELSLVIPAKNEAANLGALLREIQAALDHRFQYELIVVDDGSDDGTTELLRNIRRKGFSALRILRHDRSYGQSAAIRTGVEAARGMWIVTLDADGQNDPADIPNLMALAKSRTDENRVLVTGWRCKRQDSWVRRLSSRLANGVRSGLLKDETADTGCGLKVISRELFLSLPYFDHMHRFLPALAKRAGASLAVIEVNHRPRLAGRTKYGVWNRLWVGIVDLAGVMWLMRRGSLPARREET